jgi:hypothetical protein
MPNCLRRTCGDGSKVPSRSTTVARSSGCRPGLVPRQPGGSRTQSAHDRHRQDEVRSGAGRNSFRRHDRLDQSGFPQAHGDCARQKLQPRAAPEDQRKDSNQAFGDDRFLLHLPSRDDGIAECRKIAAAEDAIRSKSEAGCVVDPSRFARARFHGRRIWRFAPLPASTEQWLPTGDRMR